MALTAYCHPEGWQGVAIHAHAPWTGRLLYPFFHAGPWHALMNAWALLAVVFTYGVSLRRMLAAYAVAVTMPVDTLGAFLPFDSPTVGLSGVVWFLFGSISLEVARKRYYQAWMLSFLAAGFAAPRVNAWLHVYCYAAGLAAAFLNRTFDMEKKEKKE